jgi:formylglycine-generating enzyme required for sulfatase activity
MPAQRRQRTVWEQAARDADLTLELPGGVPMFFRRIPAGDFLMGSRGYALEEEPIHRVIIPHDFYLGTFVVTQEQYRAVASRCQALKGSANPSHFKGLRRPVEQVSWLDATAFCDSLGGSAKLPKGIAAGATAG